MFDIQDIVKVLGMKKPYNIQIKSKTNIKAVALYWGMYSGNKLKSHLIHIYNGSLIMEEDRNLVGIIAHELIHAKLEERGIKKAHGKSFVELANKLEYCLPGINFKGIYLEGTDI